MLDTQTDEAADFHQGLLETQQAWFREDVRKTDKKWKIVLMHKDFHDIIEYSEHPAMVYGARVSRMILDQVLACEGRLSLS